MDARPSQPDVSCQTQVISNVVCARVCANNADVSNSLWDYFYTFEGRMFVGLCEFTQ